jgi:hypothetical protein
MIHPLVAGLMIGRLPEASPAALVSGLLRPSRLTCVADGTGEAPQCRKLIKSFQITICMFIQKVI